MRQPDDHGLEVTTEPVAPGCTYIVDKVTETAKRKDEEINLAYQRALSGLILRLEVFADALAHHVELPRRMSNLRCRGSK